MRIDSCAHATPKKKYHMMMKLQYFGWKECIS